MSRSAQAGYIAFGPQVSKGTLMGSPVFYKYRATDIDFGAVEPGGLLPPEIASVLVPTGAYKLGVFAGGGMTIIPRLVDDIGWLLHGLLGDVSTSAPAGLVRTHTFKFPADETARKWFNIRKWVPASTNYAEDVTDCILARMQVTLPQAGPVTMRFDAVGRVPTFEEDPTWTEETLDIGSSFPVVGTSGSYIKLPSFDTADQLATGCIIEYVNLLTTPQQEFVIGSQYPDDFAILQRAATIRWVYKWEDPALCRTIMTGAATGASAWSPEVFTSDFEARVEGFDPDVIGSTAAQQPYRLTFKADNVSWEPNGPIRLMGNNILAQEYVGTALEPTGANEYFEVELENVVTGYTWPAA
jgi:hypothetical protein